MAIHLRKQLSITSLLIPFSIIISIFLLVPFSNDAEVFAFLIEEKENTKNISLLEKETSKEIKIYCNLPNLRLFSDFYTGKLIKNISAIPSNLLKLICNSLLTPRSPPSFLYSLI
jgi:hypothetical protein